MNKGYTILGYFMLLVTAIVWGSAFVAQRHGMSSLGPFGFNGIRMLVGWLTLSCVIGCITMFGNGGGGKGSRDTLITAGLLCGIVLGVLGLKNPEVTAATLSTLIGLGVIAMGVSYLCALRGINKFEKKVDGFRREIGIDEQ